MSQLMMIGGGFTSVGAQGINIFGGPIIYIIIQGRIPDPPLITYKSLKLEKNDATGENFIIHYRYMIIDLTIGRF